jgi:hypothetical protein
MPIAEAPRTAAGSLAVIGIVGEGIMLGSASSFRYSCY